MPEPPRWRVQRAALVAVATLLAGAAASAQVGGNLAQYPPTDLPLTISTGPAGEPVLSVQQLELVTGDYYRLDVRCTDVEDDLRGWRIEMPELLQSSHLRLVSVGDVEIHLQGLSFHAIECDEVGGARISFVPIRPGTYELVVGPVPLAMGRAPGESGEAPKDKRAVARIVVR